MEKKHHGFTFHFVLTFWHACTFKNIRFFMTTTSSLVFTTTPHTPHYHHRCRISRVWRTSKGRLWSLERLASRGYDGRARGVDPSQHRTAQQRQGEENGSEPWRCAIADGIVCVLLSSPNSTLGLVLVDGGGIIIRVVLLWSECSLCFHIYCNVTSRQRLYLELREEGWKLFCRCIWDQTGLKTHNKY